MAAKDRFYFAVISMHRESTVPDDATLLPNNQMHVCNMIKLLFSRSAFIKRRVPARGHGSGRAK